MSDHAFWIVWTSLVSTFLLVFGVFETWAIVIHKPKLDTLSAWVWHLIGTVRAPGVPLRWWQVVLRAAIGVLFLWLAEHFAIGYV